MSVLARWWLVAAIVFASAARNGIGKAQTARQVRTFINYDQAGPYEDFTDYAPDLNLNLIDNTIYSVTETGFWIFYNYTNYANSNGCSYAGVNRRVNFPYECAGQISSLRYAGSPDGLNEDFLNLYAEADFAGSEFRTAYSSTTVGGLDLAVSSLILHGTSKWTLFTGQSFTGTSVCVGAAYHVVGDDGTVIDYALHSSITSTGLPDNSIRSVQKGCSVDEDVRRGQPLSSKGPLSDTAEANPHN